MSTTKRFVLRDTSTGLEIHVESRVMHPSRAPIERHAAAVGALHPHLASSLAVEEWQLVRREAFVVTAPVGAA